MSNINEQVWEATFNQSPIGLAFVSKDGKWIKVNKRLCEILEYSETELLNTDFQSLTHPSDLESDLNMLRKVANREIEGYEILKRYLTKRNHIVWVRLTVAAVKDEKGEIMHYVSHIQPLVNGERIKMEEIGNKKVEVRPTIKFGEFISDNYQWFLGICATCVIVLVSIGVGIWGVIDKVDRFEQQMQHDRAILEKILHDEQ